MGSFFIFSLRYGKSEVTLTVTGNGGCDDLRLQSTHTKGCGVGDCSKVARSLQVGAAGSDFVKNTGLRPDGADYVMSRKRKILEPT